MSGPVLLECCVSSPGGGVLSSIGASPAGAQVFGAPSWGSLSQLGTYVLLITERGVRTAHHDGSLVRYLASVDERR